MAGSNQYIEKDIDLEPAMVVFFPVHLNDFNELLGMCWKCLYHLKKCFRSVYALLPINFPLFI